MLLNAESLTRAGDSQTDLTDAANTNKEKREKYTGVM